MGPPGKSAAGFHLHFRALIYQRFFARFVQPGCRLDNFLFAFCPQLNLKSLFIEPLLVSRFGITFHLFAGLVSGVTFYVLGACSCIRQPGCSQLTKSMRGTML